VFQRSKKEPHGLQP